MDTMSAFLKGESARASGASMVYFDGVKLKKIMEDKKVRKARIYLGGDRGYTETEVTLRNEKLSAEGIGVDGSIWATPMAEIDGEDFEIGTKDKKRMIIKFK
jgi:hypothetical protein